MTSYRKSSEVLANEAAKMSEEIAEMMCQPDTRLSVDTTFVLTAIATQTKAILALVEATRELAATIRGKQF